MAKRQHHSGKPTTGAAPKRPLGASAPSAPADGDDQDPRVAPTEITERKKLEALLREASTRQDRFLAMLGHELRNPIAPIRYLAEGLRLAPPEDPERLRRIATIILRQTGHLTRLVDDLLDAACIGEGRLQLVKRPCDLRTVVQEAAEQARPLLSERGQRLSMSLPSRSLSLHGDSTRLTQVLVNLLRNASQFSPPATLVSLTLEVEADVALLQVRDQGQGLDPEMLGQVFETFVQGDQESIDETTSGLGIGLSLAKVVVELHGGTIDALSQGHGQGSTFRVRLPLTRTAEPDEPPPTGPDRLAARRVLIVEDNPDVACSCAMLLELLDQDVEISVDGPAALEAAERLQPDLILLDLGLPGMDGVEVGRRLRATEAGRRARLVAVTGYGQGSASERTREAGFDEHLLKPLGKEGLVDVLSRCEAPIARDRPVARATAADPPHDRLGILDEDDLAPIPPEDTERLIQELRAQQIQLEIRNDTLHQTQQALEVSRARYFDLYDLAPIGYITLDEEGCIQESNLVAADLLAAPRALLAGRPLAPFLHPEDLQVHEQHRRELWASGAPQSYELRLRERQGETPWLHMATSLTPGVESGLPRWRIVLTDITARKHDELKRQEAQAQLRLVAQVADLAFWEWEPDTDAVSFPPSWQRQTGYGPESLPERLPDWIRLLHPDDRAQMLNELRQFRSTRNGEGELHYRLLRRNGSYRWFAARLQGILDGTGGLTHVLLIQQDVTERKVAEDRALSNAQQDPLTGLPMRALLDRQASQMLASAERSGARLAVLFFDLDRFKAVNDLHGHRVGDKLLQGVAQRLRDSFRAGDLVARLGGDEFVVVLSDIRDGEDAARAAQSALDILRPPYPIEGLELTIAPSIGISLFPRDGDTVEQLIQLADLAMYHAKQNDRGSYRFVTAAMNEQARQTLTLDKRLRQGLTEGELQIAFQPILSPHTLDIAGVEALVRWPQPGGESIPPQSFLHSAESTGLIHDLGQWVLTDVCRQHRVWQHRGMPPIPIAVNISDRQFQHRSFTEGVAKILEQSEVPPELLLLCITEHALMHDLKESSRALAQLKALGVRVCMRDFGIGCSSLTGLELLPLDRLEINPLLVRRLKEAEPMPAILRSIISLGRALHLQIVAVGIENAQELAFFRDEGCDEVQGFFLGSPMSGADFSDWYQTYSSARH